MNATHKNQRFFYFSESVKNSGEKLQMLPSSCLFYNFLYTWWCSKELKKYINRIPKSISSHQSFLFCAGLSFDYYVPHMPSVIANFLGRPKIEVFLERRQASPAFLVSTEEQWPPTGCRCLVYSCWIITLCCELSRYSILYHYEF